MEDKKQNNGYSAGGGKKWLIGLALLVLIAIVVVVIVITVPPSSGSAKDLVNNAAKTSFMVSEKEKNSYDSFEKKVKDTVKINDYLITMPREMENVQELSITIYEVLKFYDGNMLFIEENQSFNENFKDVKNALNKTEESQKELNKILDEANGLTGQSSTYLQNAWIEFRSEYINWLEGIKGATRSLAKLYRDCMGNVTANNMASAIVLETTADFVECIYNGFNSIVKEENENPNRSNYSYTMQAPIYTFADFVDGLIKNDGFIKDYYFNSSYKECCDKINSFLILNVQTNLLNVISSIKYVDNAVEITYEGCDDVVKNFLKGVV